MPSNMIGILITIVIYLAVMVYIGYKFSKRTKDSGDFYLGGRKLGPFVTAMSAEASDMSSWLLMGLPGVALAGSIAEASWTAIGLAIGTYVNWLIVAKRIRRYSVECNALTIPEFFHKRYSDNTRILRIVSALIIIVFFVPYTASGFSACGKLFSTIFGVNYVTAMLVSAVIIVLYTTLGGFLAASTTDFIQSIIMTVALVGVLGFGIYNAGGVGQVIDNAKSLEGYFSLNTFVSYSSGEAVKTGYNTLTICSLLAWGLGYFGMPHILLRFMAAKDESKLKLSRRIATIWVIISMFIAIAIGVIGYTLVSNGSLSLDAEASVYLQDSSVAEKIIVVIARTISEYGFVFALAAGLILAGILASTMSTADSQLLAASSSISEDIIGEICGAKITKKMSMLIARATVVIIAVISALLVLDESSSVFVIVSFAWAGFGASFGPIVLLSLFWKRSNRWGAMAGMIAGGAMVFIWKFAISKLGGIFEIYELLPAFVFALIVNIVVSLCTPAPSKEVCETFEKVSAIK